MYPPTGSHWRIGQMELLKIMNEWAPYELRDLNDAETRARICDINPSDVKAGVMGVTLVCTLEEAKKYAMSRYQQGNWPLLYFTNKGNGGLRRKRHLEQMQGRKATNYWPYSEVGHTDEAKKEIKTIFNGQSPFQTPKPSRLLQRIVELAMCPNSIVLDSFAGSGTTAHAVLNMNKADGGNRKFILVEMMDYAESITAERAKRVIDGYGSGKQTVKGTGGDFTFYDLGPVLLLPDGNLNEEVGVEKIREYVYFMETKSPIETVKEGEPYFMGVHFDSAYYFYYRRDSLTTLNHDFLGSVKIKAGRYIIYADQCTLSPAELERWHITFKKIPRDISKL